MRTFPLLASALILGLLIFQTGAIAQNNEEIQTGVRVDFSLLYNSLDLALESWDDENPPDFVRLDAYRTASGFLSGIPFHYERNRDRLTIIEQVDEVADELDYLGDRIDQPGYYYFDYSVWIPDDTYDEARPGTGYAGHGESLFDDMADARRDARREAFENAFRAALREHFTDNNEIIPGTVDGRITWYDLERDEKDFESDAYVVDLTAWISINEE
jgi:hypothetical protein